MIRALTEQPALPGGKNVRRGEVRLPLISSERRAISSRSGEETKRRRVETENRSNESVGRNLEGKVARNRTETMIATRIGQGGRWWEDEKNNSEGGREGRDDHGNIGQDDDPHSFLRVAPPGPCR